MPLPLCLCHPAATLRCGSQSAVWHCLTNFRVQRHLATSIWSWSPGTSPIHLMISSNRNQQIEGKFWVFFKDFQPRVIKMDYRSSRFHHLTFLTGINIYIIMLKASITFHIIVPHISGLMCGLVKLLRSFWFFQSTTITICSLTCVGDKDVGRKTNKLLSFPDEVTLEFNVKVSPKKKQLLSTFYLF